MATATKPQKSRNALERLVRSAAFRAMDTETRLEHLLSFKTFDELLLLGIIYDIQRAARRSGFNDAHLRKLCLGGKIDHFTRKVVGVQYFFWPEQVAGLFREHQARP